MDWRKATRDELVVKSLHPVAYADAFAAALAQKYKCGLITADPEFRTIRNLQVSGALDWTSLNEGTNPTFAVTFSPCLGFPQ